MTMYWKVEESEVRRKGRGKDSEAIDLASSSAFEVSISPVQARGVKKKGDNKHDAVSDCFDPIAFWTKPSAIWDLYIQS